MSDLPNLCNETIWAILKDEIDDLTVNQMVWHHLGYRYIEGRWDNTLVDDQWKQDYSQPPNFIENRTPTVKLTRSIAQEHKQALKETLGFTGWKIGEFNPRDTRRATIANWLLSQLFKQENQDQG